MPDKARPRTTLGHAFHPPLVRRHRTADRTAPARPWRPCLERGVLARWPAHRFRRRRQHASALGRRHSCAAKASTVIPSIPGAPLLRRTCASASLRLSRSTIASMHGPGDDAGLWGSALAAAASVASPKSLRASRLSFYRREIDWVGAIRRVPEAPDFGLPARACRTAEPGPRAFG